MSVYFGCYVSAVFVIYSKSVIAIGLGERMFALTQASSEELLYSAYRN